MWTVIMLCLIALFIIASLLPFSLDVRGARDENLSYKAAFRWPWRTFGIGMRRDAQGRYFQLLFGNKCLYERERQKTRKKRKKKEKKEKKAGGFSLLKDRELLARLIRAGLRFLRDLLSCFRRPRLVGDVEIGFGDPMIMGIISGVVYAVSPTGMTLDHLKIKPNYVDEIATGEVDLDVRALPGRVLIVFIKLIFYFPIIGLLRLSRRKKKIAKEREVSKNGA